MTVCSLLALTSVPFFALLGGVNNYMDGALHLLPLLLHRLDWTTGCLQPTVQVVSEMAHHLAGVHLDVHLLWGPFWFCDAF